MRRFICTHTDDDHLKGIEKLDKKFPMADFDCVKKSQRRDLTDSFIHYFALRIGGKAFFLEKISKRKWPNQGDAERKSSGLQILWPDTSRADFKEALRKCDAGEGSIMYSAY